MLDNGVARDNSPHREGCVNDQLRGWVGRVCGWGAKGER